MIAKVIWNMKNTVSGSVVFGATARLHGVGLELMGRPIIAYARDTIPQVGPTTTTSTSHSGPTIQLSTNLS